MKTTRFSRTWKFRSIRKEERDRSRRLLLFLALTAIASLCWTGETLAEIPFRLTDINDTGDSSPSCLTDVDGTLFFVADPDPGTVGLELWRSDGTAVGTVRVREDVNPGAGDANAAYLTNLNGKLLFGAREFAATGDYELWTYDVNNDIIQMIDVNPGYWHSSPRYLTVCNDYVFFNADEETTGVELWKSDGTAAGTEIVSDINPGAGHTNPNYLINRNGTLFRLIK